MRELRQADATTSSFTSNTSNVDFQVVVAACGQRRRTRLPRDLLEDDSARTLKQSRKALQKAPTRYNRYGRCSAGNDNGTSIKLTAERRAAAGHGRATDSERFGTVVPESRATGSRRPSSRVYASTMVTSTSTPGSMEMLVICLTTSAGEWRSIRRLWMRSW